MSDGEDVGWIRLGVRGMVPPGAASEVPGSTAELTEDMTLDVHGITLVPQDTDGLEPGMELIVTRPMGRKGEYARPLAEHRREQDRKERRRELKDRASERAAWRRKRKAREFWNQYDIPFEWDVAIKGRLSGLSRGSWGDGRAANTVDHLFTRESFSEGRLSRPEGCYLCHTERDSSPRFQFDGERRTDPDGEEYIPPVTCSGCLERMDRWKVTDGDDSE